MKDILFRTVWFYSSDNSKGCKILEVIKWWNNIYWELDPVLNDQYYSPLYLTYWYYWWITGTGQFFNKNFPFKYKKNVLFYVLWIVICYMTDDWTFCHAMFKNHTKAECFPFYSGNTKTSKKYSSKLTLVTCLKIDLTFITNITVRLKKRIIEYSPSVFMSRPEKIFFLITVNTEEFHLLCIFLLQQSVHKFNLCKIFEETRLRGPLWNSKWK